MLGLRWQARQEEGKQSQAQHAQVLLLPLEQGGKQLCSTQGLQTLDDGYAAGLPRVQHLAELIQHVLQQLHICAGAHKGDEGLQQIAVGS